MPTRSGESATVRARSFAAELSLEASWVAGEWLAHQPLELEVDLIAAHLLAIGRVPAAQFLG